MQPWSGVHDCCLTGTHPPLWFSLRLRLTTNSSPRARRSPQISLRSIWLHGDLFSRLVNALKEKAPTRCVDT